MPNLRGHHLICLHFFNGEGYNPEFVENLKDVLKKTKYEDIEIGHGADDICNKCPHMKHDRCLYNERADEEISVMDKRALELLKISKDTRVRWQELKEIIPEIFRSWYESYCNTCGWRWACEKHESYQRLKNNL